MSPSDLSRQLASATPPVLLHVLPEEVFNACRIPGSHNACVYETAFLDHVASITSDFQAAIVVYGAGDGSLDAQVAVEKLRAAGYAGVEMLEDGLEGWQAAGFATEGNHCMPTPPMLDGIYRIDTAASVIRWTGRNLFNQHYGTIRLSSGEISIRKGLLVSARFAIDMNSIACADLADSQWNAMLIQHLKTADFFLTDRFPVAEFIAGSVEPVSTTVGAPTHLLKGSFTLRGVTRPLEFPVVVASADGKRLTGQGQFEIDRTDYGSVYGSGKFFRHLGKHVVNDLLHLDVMIHADAVEG